VKYLPIVVYFEPTGTWYVIPPQVVVSLVSRKTRGQHTENPFESATLNLGALGSYAVTDPRRNLAKATLRAVEDGDRYPQLRDAMAVVILADSRSLAEKSRVAVQRILDTYGI